MRPANFAPRARARPRGRAGARRDSRSRCSDLMGSLFLDVPHSPWRSSTSSWTRRGGGRRSCVVDMHGEATSEKVAMAFWLDGRVTAVIGTHTHVQTNDARILPGGTAAMTDAGMTGPHDSVIGVRTELIPATPHGHAGPLRARDRRRPHRGRRSLECDPATGRATSCETLQARARGRLTSTAGARAARGRARRTRAATPRSSVRRVVPVLPREPGLGQHERDGEQRRGGEAPAPAHERHERDEPEEELRREHLPERDERDHARRPRRGRAARAPSGRAESGARARRARPRQRRS